MTELSDWIARVRSAERSGDLTVAYDYATQGLTEYPNSVDLRYLATRVLARSGATEQAAALYKHFGLGRRRELDIAALGARIAKDRALGASANRRMALRKAAVAYGRVYARTRNHYPAVNAATLYLLAGDHERAHAYAGRALDASSRGSDRTSIDRYYRLASRAEAALICRDVEMARQALQEAADHVRDDFDAAATTRKQLRLVCQAVGASTDILDFLRPPAVVHYYTPTLASHGLGHVPNRQLQRKFVDKIIGNLTQIGIGYAYGSLSAGSDILCAEACLKANVELHIVLPFNESEFVETMVSVAGPSWVRRFKTCLGRANSVTFATTDSFQDDDELFAYACRLAMGMAILRARHLDTVASHFKLETDGWDPNAAGYATNLQMWEAQGHASHLLTLTGSSNASGRRQRGSARRKVIRPRFSRALIFGDVAGFSRTPDCLMPVFHKRFMGTIAAVLRRYRRHVLYRNSWGDAIYVVMDDPIVASRCCLAIQEAITNAKLARYGLPLALRLAAHFGPVYEGHDPIRDEATFFGGHTILASRIEPVTPPGHVYVTEAMAAALAMASTTGLRVEYVGNVPMAKGFGSTRMYSLNRCN